MSLLERVAEHLPILPVVVPLFAAPLSVLLLNTFAPTIDHFVVQANIKRRLARS